MDYPRKFTGYLIVRSNTPNSCGLAYTCLNVAPLVLGELDYGPMMGDTQFDERILRARSPLRKANLDPIQFPNSCTEE